MKIEINGIIIDGKVYEPIYETDDCGCEDCALKDFICNLEDYCIVNSCHFRFSQELTDKINER